MPHDRSARASWLIADQLCLQLEAIPADKTIVEDQAKLLGPLLVEENLLAPEQLERALQFARNTGLPLDQIVVAEFAVSQPDISRLLARGEPERGWRREDRRRRGRRRTTQPSAARTPPPPPDRPDLRRPRVHHTRRSGSGAHRAARERRVAGRDPDHAGKDHPARACKRALRALGVGNGGQRDDGEPGAVAHRRPTWRRELSARRALRRRGASPIARRARSRARGRRPGSRGRPQSRRRGSCRARPRHAQPKPRPPGSPTTSSANDSTS